MQRIRRYLRSMMLTSLILHGVLNSVLRFDTRVFRRSICSTAELPQKLTSTLTRDGSRHRENSMSHVCNAANFAKESSHNKRSILDDQTRPMNESNCAGLSVHVDARVGGQLPGAPGGREGDRVLRRKEPALCRLPNHRSAAGVPPVLRLGRDTCCVDGGTRRTILFCD